MKSLSFGEVLWDLIDDKEHIGGAPFNVAAHLSLLGYESFMLTRVGKDRLGTGALAEMDRLGVVRTYTQVDPGRTTGWAKVSLDACGSATFAFPDNPAYNFISTDSVTLASLKRLKLDAICFGTLVQNGNVSRESLLQVLKAASAPHVFYDVNVRMEFYPLEVVRTSLELSTIVKLNDDELPKVSTMLYGNSLTESDFVSRLISEFPVKVVCITKGAAGCSVYAAGEFHEVPGIPVKVVDTVGAGDAFSAAFLRHYIRTGNVAEAAHRGNLLGAYVASQAGAVPEYSAEIRRLLA